MPLGLGVVQRGVVAPPPPQRGVAAPGDGHLLPRGVLHLEEGEDRAGISSLSCKGDSVPVIIVRRGELRKRPQLVLRWKLDAL